MILKNPTDQRLKVQIDGVWYTAEPKGTVELPERHAMYWKNKIHGFMVITSSTEAVSVPKVVDEEPVTEVVAEVVAEVTETPQPAQVRKAPASRKPKK